MQAARWRAASTRKARERRGWCREATLAWVPSPGARVGRGAGLRAGGVGFGQERWRVSGNAGRDACATVWRAGWSGGRGAAMRLRQGRRLSPDRSDEVGGTGRGAGLRAGEVGFGQERWRVSGIAGRDACATVWRAGGGSERCGHEVRPCPRRGSAVGGVSCTPRSAADLEVGSVVRESSRPKVGRCAACGARLRGFAFLLSSHNGRRELRRDDAAPTAKRVLPRTGRNRAGAVS